MATAGYSGTPLLQKLGIKSAMKILLINQPDNYFDWLETNITDQLCRKDETPDLVHLFVKNIKEFEEQMKKLKSFFKTNQLLLFGCHGIKKPRKYLPILLKISSATMHCEMDW